MQITPVIIFSKTELALFKKERLISLAWASTSSTTETINSDMPAIIFLATKRLKIQRLQQ